MLHKWKWENCLLHPLRGVNDDELKFRQNALSESLNSKLNIFLAAAASNIPFRVTTEESKWAIFKQGYYKSEFHFADWDPGSARQDSPPTTGSPVRTSQWRVGERDRKGVGVVGQWLIEGRGTNVLLITASNKGLVGCRSVWIIWW